ncbi:MAG TPA: ABC transporter ATP-binding protein [Dehalococcoidia bacterium]
MVEPMIRARDLVKRFGAFTAVGGISFDVMPGECFGILGPNGAGKTSTIRMVTCVSPVTAGTLTVDGMDVRHYGREIRSILGVVAQSDNLDQDLTVWQNLMIYARYFDIPRRVAAERAREALALFQLLDRADADLNQLSGGMKRRLAIARALVNQPKVLVLDEPTTGLDPQARQLVWQKLRSLKAQGITTLLTTHYMEEAAQLCDRLVIMHEGRILVEGRPRDLVREHVGAEVWELRLDGTEREAVLARLPRDGGYRVEETEDVVYVFSQHRDGRELEALDQDDERVLRRRATLEDVFLKLTGRGLLEE